MYREYEDARELEYELELAEEVLKMAETEEEREEISAEIDELKDRIAFAWADEESEVET